MEQSWTNALWRYDSLIEAGWTHVRPFRALVEVLGRSPETSGLTAVTSHETLLISPFIRYPEWFDRRHVRLTPLHTGAVQVSRHPERPRPVEFWTMSLEDARAKALELCAAL